MKIFITGISGMLGYYMGQQYSRHYEVYGCDLIDLHDIFGKVHFSKIDLTDFELLFEKLKTVQPELIIHTAAMINVDACEKEREKAELVNVKVTEELAKMAGRLNAKFVYVSTDAVFDGYSDGFYREDSSPNPLNYYGETKLRGELAVQKHVENHIICRTNIYGWSKRSKQSFVEWLIDSLKTVKRINLFHDMYYTPIYVGSFCNILLDLLSNKFYGLIHLAGNEVCSKLEFAQKVAVACNLSLENTTSMSIDDFPFVAKRPKIVRLSVDKLHDTLGYWPQSIEEDLEKMIKEKMFFA